MCIITATVHSCSANLAWEYCINVRLNKPEPTLTPHFSSNTLPSHIQRMHYDIDPRCEWYVPLLINAFVLKAFMCACFKHK